MKLKLTEAEAQWLFEAIEGKPSRNVDGARVKADLMLKMCDMLEKKASAASE